MINQYLAQNQEQRRLQILNGLEIGIEKNNNNQGLSSQDDSENYSAGEFDGKIGDIPDKNLFKFFPYRAGYQSGIVEYYLKKYGIQIRTQS